jgi:hypothetical protein
MAAEAAASNAPSAEDLRHRTHPNRADGRARLRLAAPAA